MDKISLYIDISRYVFDRDARLPWIVIVIVLSPSLSVLFNKRSLLFPTVLQFWICFLFHNGIKNYSFGGNNSYF